MGRKLSLFYIGTIILVQPYWVAEIYANFAYFNDINRTVYEKIRPWEALFRYDAALMVHLVFIAEGC